MFEVCADIGKNSRAGVEQETGSQMRKGGEPKRTEEEKQRQRRLHTTCKWRLCFKLLVYVCICAERVAS